MAKVPCNVDDLTEEAAKELLKKIVNKLDDLDGDDFFGSEGWKHFMGLRMSQPHRMTFEEKERCYPMDFFGR